MHKRENIKKWIKSHHKALIIFSVILLFSASAWALQLDSKVNSQRIDRDTSGLGEVPLTMPGLLTGIEVDPRIARRPVTAVVIENSPTARPQSGLDSAGIVFEAVTEGGITRFLALYQEQSPDKVGPIRSLRVPFVDWYQGFNAAIAHVGGSAEALQLIKVRSSRSLTQFMHAEQYYRTGDRPAPHNVYSAIPTLRSLQMRMGYTTSTFKSIPRSDDNPAETPSATRIVIDFSSSLFQAEFRYQKSSNSYTRHQAGSAHIDRETGSPIQVKNVVVIKMPSRQSGQYVDMDTIGSGDAVLFKDGVAREIKWRQRSHRQRIELLDGNGEEVALNRGQTWFSVLSTGRSLTY